MNVSMRQEVAEQGTDKVYQLRELSTHDVVDAIGIYIVIVIAYLFQ